MPSVFPDYAAPIVRNQGMRNLSGNPTPPSTSKARRPIPRDNPRQSAPGAVLPGHFPFRESRPLAFFAGIWTPKWTSVRKLKEGAVTVDLFGFLTTQPNELVGTYHPKAMPVILTTREEIELWMTAPIKEALKLQRPLSDDALVVVARGGKKDPENLAADLQSSHISHAAMPAAIE